MVTFTSARPTTDRPMPIGHLSRRPRGWTVAGLAAAVAAIAGLVAGPVSHTVTAGAALLLVPFAAGLWRHLTAWTSAASLVPTVAFAGLLLTAATAHSSAVGTGLTALAVAVAARRHRVYGRPTELMSLALGGTTTLLAISPLEHLAAVTGPLWLLIYTTGLVLDVRRTPGER